MSTASKCDKCGALYERERGCVVIETIGVITGKDPDRFSNWSDIDLCRKCGKDVLDALRHSMQDLPKKL